MLLDAFISGLVSAVSLVIGALVGIAFRPGHSVVAATMSFGAGALLAALTFELIEPAFARGGLAPLAVGLIGGAVLFVGINATLDGSGGFLRKGSTQIVQLRRRKQQETRKVLDELSQVGIMRALPPEEMQAIVPAVERVSAPAGAHIVERGDEGDALYLVVSGEVEVLTGEAAAAPLAVLGPGEAFGEMALLTGEPRTATVRARTDIELLRVPKSDYDRLLDVSPRLSRAVSALLARRLGTTTGRSVAAEIETRRWRQEAERAAPPPAPPTGVERREFESARAGAAAVGIYLGLFLDGIPESLSIGALMVGGASFNVPFIVALFLSNLPEATSSSVIMRRIGYGTRRIVIMWTGLMLFTGIGAVVGNVVFSGASPSVIAVTFAVAAGAMLAMLAQTAMPEAYEQGGWVVGIATVLGFLAAYSMKAIAPAH